ncbi:hypothetical protein SAMN05443634_10313 [Chishuiella changwenlii]|uniref:Uncharacterized protein n=1 Tax=Chishuiella changwenlii TaxID=1434701 RepID=A0A1M6UQ57_9FLAO|nr:hypothetical protein [Chishuiella changwenlii]GGF11776.1 hypothetical protein GCM10010984_30930 [Chishuiella changwenlii]SHK71347.1 hypothetical protein SAMN05443634_10313 [Chishuiella changwenlii]
MKLYIKLALFTIVIFLSNCNTSINIPKNKFVYKSKNRTLEVYFKDDNSCLITNTFHCPDIDENYKIIKMEFDYLRKGDTIFLNNKNPSYEEGLYLKIPEQESEKCDFLNKEKRERYGKFVPTYSTDFEKYGIVPNLNIDTLYIIKNKITFFKKNSTQSIGFIFK